MSKGISTATASRDIRLLLDEGKIESAGSGRMTRYKNLLYTQINMAD